MYTTCGEVEHIALGFEIVNLAVVRGNACPRLDADVGSFGLGSVPEAHILHAGVSYLDKTLGNGGLQRNLGCHIGEEYGVIIEEIVREGEALAAANLEGLGFAHENQENVLNNHFPISFVNHSQ